MFRVSRSRNGELACISADSHPVSTLRHAGGSPGIRLFSSCACTSWRNTACFMFHRYNPRNLHLVDQGGGPTPRPVSEPTTCWTPTFAQSCSADTHGCLHPIPNWAVLPLCCAENSSQPSGVLQCSRQVVTAQSSCSKNMVAANARVACMVYLTRN